MLDVYKNLVCFYFWGTWQGQIIYFTISEYSTTKLWESDIIWERKHPRQSMKNKNYNTESHWQILKKIYAALKLLALKSTLNFGAK